MCAPNVQISIHYKPSCVRPCFNLCSSLFSLFSSQVIVIAAMGNRLLLISFNYYTQTVWSGLLIRLQGHFVTFSTERKPNKILWWGRYININKVFRHQNQNYTTTKHCFLIQYTSLFFSLLCKTKIFTFNIIKEFKM